MDTTGKSGWDKVGDYDWHIYTTVYKTESRIRRTYCMDRELYSMLCSDLNGKEIKKKKERIYVHIQLPHFALRQKLAQHCKAMMRVSRSVTSDSL